MPPLPVGIAAQNRCRQLAKRTTLTAIPPAVGVGCSLFRGATHLMDKPAHITSIAEKRNGWRPCQRLDIVHKRGHVPQAVRLQLRRAISWFGTLVFNRTDKRRLLAANVAARADKDLDAH